ncbi:hypothetical protein [Hymenobacter cheonanensis]|uniref:hypothetical protein n=1 Tax=Hymenobacter sp. CA2-7 TaxID=3063993 RepID=UPI002712DD07|nr:hypothetical protein [Hymenobacter sp. CA2-7]MDO7886413.1 hypothetical protein [Hymenobacter sp. CA2-7]
MSGEIKNLEVKEAKTAKPAPKAPADKSEKDKPKKPDPKHDKPKAQLHKLATYAGTVGEYGANPDGIYDRLTLATADAAYTVKFPPHFGQALQGAAQSGAAATVLGYLHTTPKGDEHLHLASLEVGGQPLQPQPASPAAEPVTVQGKVAELLRDPKGHPRALRLAGAAGELRFPPHLGEQLAEYLAPGAAVQASGQRRADRPGEVRAPGSVAPLHLELLTVGGESFLIR